MVAHSQSSAVHAPSQKNFELFQLDKAFESIVNIFFYVILACIVLAALGINPLVLFASISGFVLGFAFMIGAACSKYFEVRFDIQPFGPLLILLSRDLLTATLNLGLAHDLYSPTL